MTSALLNGFIGLGLCLLIGMQVLQFAPSDISLLVVVSNLSALVSLLATLQAEKNPWLKKNFLNHFLKTWLCLAALYFGILLAFCPLLRSLDALLYLGLPLILSTGFGILFFGPIQDQIVRKAQRSAKSVRS